jgi:MarR family transcriptional regulator, organic hydroperoxide resistance regulator
MATSLRTLELDRVSERTALSFLRLLWEIHHGLQAASKRMEREIGLTGPQRLVLRILDGSPGMTASQLAELLHLDRSTLTGIVRRLQRGGFVRRAADPHDGRRFLLAVTPKARTAISNLTGTIEQRIESALGTVLASQLAGAEAALAVVAAALGDGGDERPPGRPRKRPRRR